MDEGYVKDMGNFETTHCAHDESKSQDEANRVDILVDDGYEVQEYGIGDDDDLSEDKLFDVPFISRETNLRLESIVEQVIGDDILSEYGDLDKLNSIKDDGSY